MRARMIGNFLIAQKFGNFRAVQWFRKHTHIFRSFGKMADTSVAALLTEWGWQMLIDSFKGKFFYILD